MKNNTTYSWIILAWIFVAVSIPINAQTTEPDAPIRGWGFDEFHIGGETIPHPRICKDSLNMDFLYTYGGYTNSAIMLDSSRWDSTIDRGRMRGFSSIVQQADSVGIKLIYAVDNTFHMQKNIRSYDWYYDSRSDTVDIKDYRDRIASSNAAVDSVYWIRDRFIAGVAVSRSGSSTPDSLFTMGAPRFTQQVTERGNGDYYTKVLKVPDSSMWFDFRVMLKTDQTLLANDESIADNAPLAYLDVIRRVVVSRDASCDSCRCPFYVRIAHLPITKQMYLELDVKDQAYKHKQFTFLMNLLDTSRSDGQVYGQEHLGYPSPTYSDTLSRCDSVLARWKQQGIVPPTTFRRVTNSDDGASVLEQGDLHFNITSTRLVPLQVLGGSISQHIFDYLDRPQRYSTSYRMDSLIYSQLDTLINDPMLWPMMAYISLWDEPVGIDFNAYRIITSKVQRRIRELHPTDQTKWRGCYNNSLGGFGTMRVQTGDFDSTAQRSVSLIMTHSYPINVPAPSYYADKSKIQNDSIFDLFFNKYRWDSINTTGYPAATHFPSTIPAHNEYNRQMVGIDGGMTTKMTVSYGAIDDAQFKFEYLGKPKIPVYNNIQTAGYLEWHKDAYFTGKWATPGTQIRTPETITAQAWWSLNNGVQGLMFSDLQTTGPHFGIFSAYGIDQRRSDQEILDSMMDYGALELYHPSFPNANQRIPRMWLGYKQRFDAIKKVTSAIKRIDTLYTKLLYNQEQISVDQSQINPESKRNKFWNMPLVDTAYTIQANRTIKPDTISGYRKYQSDSIPLADSIQHTYLEITHYKFKDQQRSATGERVLLVTNKRTWPIDWDHDSTNPYWDGNYGLGAIDVRLPVLRLKNSTGVVADSFIIERVGEPYAWRDTGAFGQNLPLQWLEPGWGAMYRVIPLASGVSDYGTSFSNAVRSLKVGGRQFVVFERDSSIFLRTFDEHGVWNNTEWRISDADDTSNIAESGYQQFANNMYPAIAKPFDANSLMIVWERKDNYAGTSTIEACRLDTLPTTATLPDTTRRSLAPPVTLTANWMRLMPSVVGIIGDGYIASWSRAPLKGINVVAIRDKNNFSVSNDVSQRQVAYASAADPDVGFTPDTNAWHSSLAHVPRDRGRSSIGIPGSPNGGSPAWQDLSWVHSHLAYQQGTPDQANSQFIFYNTVYSRIGATGQPGLTLSSTEHVSKGLDGCGFLHPCIAADSARIGVAFQLNTAKNRYVVLRFRDSIDVQANVVGTDTNGNQLGVWTTPAYKYGGEFWLPTIFPPTSPIIIKPVYFERPSVTEFPASAKLSMDGGLSWVWTNMKEVPGMSQHTGVMMYRYGWKQPELMAFGHYPTMTLAPTATEDGFAQTSIFHRGDTMQRFWRDHRYFDSVRYYPSYVLNTPAEKNAFFSATPATRNIHSFVNLIQPEIYCNGWMFGGGIGHDWIDGTPEHPPTPPGGMPPTGIPTGGIPTPPTGYPGLPPIFFQPPGGIATTTGTGITTLEEATNINRTSVFTAATHPVNIRRVILRNSGLQAWLASAPFDSLRNAPANIYLLTELVRASDSAVLWRGDTVTARDFDTVLQEEMVEVPVGLVASPGTGVFVRLRTEASQGLSYVVESGFHFGQRFDTTSSMAKRSWHRQRKGEAETGGEAMSAEVIPNPMQTGRVKVRLEVHQAGAVQLGLYTLLGQQIAALPDAEIQQSGAYWQEVDLSGLRPGIYLLVAQQGNQKASAKVTVVGK